MKSIIRIIFSLIPLVTTAQDSVLTINPSMFDKSSNQFLIATADDWMYKKGNDTNWAKKNIDVTDWKKMKPTELSVKNADQHGKVECWFRIKIKIDSSFDHKLLGFKTSTWAATDLYINGKLVFSSGNTGNNGKAFQENHPFGTLPFNVHLMPGIEYTLALHFLDYVSPMPPFDLKSKDTDLRNIITLTSPDFISSFLKSKIQQTTYETIWVSVFSLISLLFCLLYLQNRKEKDLLPIALYPTILTATFLLVRIGDYVSKSYAAFLILNYAINFFQGLSFALIPIIIAKIFKRKVSGALKLLLIIILLLTFLSGFVSRDIADVLYISMLIILISISIYYIVSSWEKLKGAQWLIVAGLLLSLVLLLLFVFMTRQIQHYPYLYLTTFVLSFPVALLLYVASRFKEIIIETQKNAQIVVQLSEEKKKQAINQQKILQEEVNRQTLEIRTTLENLKSTQSQLIQSEKMASLGELTAGIAHEIQNPLNFVNNFSEVNQEMMEELKAERRKPDGERDESLQDELINDVIENSEKINHHGKRADAIVKGMLQHSRTSSGQKEPTAFNALCDEYLRLSYHGMRAKDKSFNAEMKTDFDESIGKINIIPQDIGRVLLNLFNNAFYAVNEQKRRNLISYEPTVSVKTKHTTGGVTITVADNGNGIPEKIKEKIFQPFFTTKPTGSGTGLGLSLTYDIITKEHAGMITVNSKEGEGTEFIVNLPINN